MEIKHRCSQPQFRTLAAWCWDAVCCSWGRSWVGPLSPLRVGAPSPIAHWKTNVECYFHFSPFFVKAKILFRFPISKNRYWCRPLSGGHNVYLPKTGYTCIGFCQMYLLSILTISIFLFWNKSYLYPVIPLGLWYSEIGLKGSHLLPKMNWEFVPFG